MRNTAHLSPAWKSQLFKFADTWSARCHRTPERRHQFIRSAIAADAATQSLLPLIREVYFFKAFEVAKSYRGYKRLEEFAFLSYEEATDRLKDLSREQVFRVFDLYDIAFLNVGRAEKLAVSAEESRE